MLPPMSLWHLFNWSTYQWHVKYQQGRTKYGWVFLFLRLYAYQWIDVRTWIQFVQPLVVFVAIKFFDHHTQNAPYDWMIGSVVPPTKREYKRQEKSEVLTHKPPLPPLYLLFANDNMHPQQMRWFHSSLQAGHYVLLLLIVQVCKKVPVVCTRYLYLYRVP